LSIPLNVLIVEDSEDDALLLVRNLRRGGYDVAFERVETVETMIDALNRRIWDLVISDYTMPHLRGADALKLVRERDPDIPFIFLSGTIGEETAVTAMKYGANDYVFKSNFKRLLPAIERELREAQMRREHRKAEKALWESEERYRTLAEAAQDTIFIIKRDGYYQYINSYGARTYGHRPEEIIGRSIEDLFPAPVVERQKSSIRKILETGEDANEEMRISISGEERWVESHLVPIKDTAGNINAILGMARDITERKLAEERLQETTQRLQLATSSGGIGIWDWEIPSNRLIWDDRMFELYGVSMDTFASTAGAWEKGLHPEDHAAAMEAIRSALCGEKEFNTEFRVLHPDGTVKFLQANGIVIRDVDGKPLRMIGMNRDVTEQRNLEQQLRESQKIEAVGRLAGGIAHDFNNLLTVILGYSELMLGQLDEKSSLLKDVDEIKRAGERASSLTRQLLAFSRRQVLQPKVLDLNGVVSCMEKMLLRLIEEDVDFRTVLGKELWSVKADPGQIEQVVMNLVVNAKDAMPGGGKLTIETSNISLGEGYSRGHPSVPPGPYVMLAISDTGMGMDDATRSRIFEPFFTTKERAKGTGLGLSTVYGIVKQSGGFIWVYSEPGKGSTFKVYLPRTEDREDAREKEVLVDEDLRGRKTVLAVEDDDSIRKLAVEILEKYGYTVLSASDGVDAERVSEAHEEEISLLLTDVVMPRMGGVELYKQLRRQRPDIKVLYVSGYTDNAIVHHGVLNAGVAFLQKPYAPISLARKVKEVLEATD
jgi:PAS domain S-box-containing protein